MKRLAASLVLSLAVLLPAAGSAAAAALLRPSATIDAEVIRLGDLFDNLGARADAVVAHAPQPGRRVVLEAEWLATIAANFGVAWRPASRADRIAIERRSVVVGADDILPELKLALAQAGAPADLDLQLVNRSLQMHMPTDAAVGVSVRDVEYEPRSGRFAATIELSGSGLPVRSRVSGRAFAVAEMPVLVRPMQRGDIIRDEDVEWRPVRADLVQAGVVADIDQLVGQQLRNPGRAGQPLRGADLRRPIVVAKNSVVTMVLQGHGLSLTAQGRAVEDGGAGDIIRVTNTHSKLTVEAKVEGAGVVAVLPTGRILAN